MKLSNFEYLLSIFLFCVPVALIVWKLYGSLLRKYKKVLLLTILVSLPIGLAEGFALRWGAWAFNPDSVIGFRVGGQIESYLFLVGVIVAYGSIVLVLVDLYDSRHKKLGPRKNPKISVRPNKRRG